MYEFLYKKEYTIEKNIPLYLKNFGTVLIVDNKLKYNILDKL